MATSPDLVIAPGDPTPPAGTYRHIVILPGAEIKPVGIIRTTDGLRILSQASDIAAELLAMLRKHEWVSDREESTCPECGGQKPFDGETGSCVAFRDGLVEPAT